MSNSSVLKHAENHGWYESMVVRMKTNNASCVGNAKFLGFVHDEVCLVRGSPRKYSASLLMRGEAIVEITTLPS